MLDFERSKNYDRNRLTADGGKEGCVICGKDIKDAKYWLHLFWGLTAVTEEEAAEINRKEGDGGDMYFFPIGTDCLKRHPELKPYATVST
jgi:hypothetical protein